MQSIRLFCLLILFFYPTVSAQQMRFSVALEDFITNEEFHEGIAAFYKNGLYGGINTAGKVVIKPRFYSSFSFRNGIARVKNHDDKYGLIDKNGHFLCDYQYDYISEFNNDIAFVELDGKYGIINRRGKLRVPCRYENVLPIAANLMEIKENGKSGLADSRIICEPKYDFIYAFKNYPIIYLQKGEEQVYYHIREKRYLNEYATINYLGDGIAKATKKDGGLHILDSLGHVILDHQLLSPKGVISFKKQDQWGFKNEDRLLIEPKYTDIDGIFLHGAMRVSIGNNKQGYVNEDGFEFVSPEYKRVGVFSRHKIGVVEKENGKKGVVNLAGKLVIPCEFDEVVLEDAFVLVKKGDYFGTYSVEGELLTNISFAYIREISDTLYMTQTEVDSSSLYGLMNRHGIEVVEPKFLYINAFYDGIACARLKDGRMSFIDTSGRVLFREDDEWSICGGFSEGVAPIRSKKDIKYHYLFNPYLNEDDLSLVYIKAAYPKEETFVEHAITAFELYNKGNYKDALPLFNASLKNSAVPDYELYNARGCCFWQLNDHKSAIQDYERAIRINPDYDQARDNLKVCKKERKSRRWDTYIGISSIAIAGLSIVAGSMEQGQGAHTSQSTQSYNNSPSSAPSFYESSNKDYYLRIAEMHKAEKEDYLRKHEQCVRDFEWNSKQGNHSKAETARKYAKINMDKAKMQEAWEEDARKKAANNP